MGGGGPPPGGPAPALSNAPSDRPLRPAHPARPRPDRPRRPRPRPPSRSRRPAPACTSPWLRNTGIAALSGWTPAFACAGGQAPSGLWGGAVTVKPASRTATVPAGGSVTVGSLASKGAADTAPTALTVNGRACATG
ncbi:cellulose binding domain-containing protein [Streptomyces longwoodensis]|uniref:cellulose binding domain-containing protein n=1 Tax=Streptomyces longwoodensis TaxID=68231 RepID=UPI0033ED7AE8